MPKDIAAVMLVVFVGATADVATAGDEIRVGFTSKCPLSQEGTRESALPAIGVAIAADVGGRIVGGLIDELGAAMSDAKVTSFQTVGRMDGFYNIKAGEKDIKLNTAAGCLVLVVGDFSDPPAKPMFPLRKENKGNTEPNEVPAAVATVVGLKGTPKLYLEGVFETSTDREAIAFVPTYLYVPNFLNKGSLFSSSTRDLLIRIEWFLPGTDQSFGSAEFSWMGVSQTDSGVVIAAKEALVTKQTAWFKAPDISPKHSAGAFGPTNVKVLVSETAKPFTIAKYVGEALKAQKEQATAATKNAITQSLSTEARLEARLKLNEAARTSLAQYLTAYDEASSAYDAWSAEADPAKKVGKLNSARQAYQRVPANETLARRAFRDAGLPFDARPPLKPLP